MTDFSNTALWTIPYFEFWEYFTNFAVKLKTFLSHFQVVQTVIRGVLQEPTDLGLNCSNLYCQKATRLKRLTTY